MSKPSKLRRLHRLIHIHARRANSADGKTRKRKHEKGCMDLVKTIGVQDGKKDQTATRRETHDERNDRARPPVALVLYAIHSFVMASKVDRKEGTNERKCCDYPADTEKGLEAECANVGDEAAEAVSLVTKMSRPPGNNSRYIGIALAWIARSTFGYPVDQECE